MLGLNPVVENEGGEYVLEKRWEDVGEAGVEIQWMTEEQRLTQEALHDSEGRASNVHTEGTRRISTTIVEID
ncbi:hypothetical protein BGZ76_006607, partial [Entomortierella beljakovae]